MAFCGSCGASVTDGTTICSACGKPIGAAMAAPATAGAGASVAAAPAAASTGGMTSNVAGALAYIWILAIVWLLIEPYKNDKFVRFHSFQSLFFCVALFIMWFPLWIVAIILAFIPFVGHVVAAILFPAYGLAIFVVWLVLIFKAYSNEQFKLPFIGDLAAKQVG